MKLEKVAPIAEIVSSAAIVLTLIYLTIQTQQTNDALIANSRQGLLMADLTMIDTLVNNPEVEVNSRRPVGELTATEDSQVANEYASLLRSREFAWLQYQAGILDKATFDSYMETMIRMTSEYQGYRHYWDQYSKRTNPEFTQYVNAMLEQYHP
jgi:hypothetical protein